MSLLSLQGAGCERRRAPCRYLVPDGYIGWVRIYYEVSDAAPLPIEDGHLVFAFPASGELRTSSSPQYGSATDEFFYTRGDSRILLDSRDEGAEGMIRGEYFGGSRGSGVAADTEAGFFVGTRSQYEKHLDEPPGASRS